MASLMRNSSLRRFCSNTRDKYLAIKSELDLKDFLLQFIQMPYEFRNVFWEQEELVLKELKG